MLRGPNLAGPFGTYDDHGEEGEAHEDTLHVDEQHGARQVLQHSGVEAGDHPTNVCSCQGKRTDQPQGRDAAVPEGNTPPHVISALESVQAVSDTQRLSKDPLAIATSVQWSLPLLVFTIKKEVTWPEVRQFSLAEVFLSAL